MLQIGSVVDGKYKILSEIGHGGMSVVYLAINERANKTWAIKEVRRDGTVDSAVVVNGLVAETNMLKKLNNPHLPSIIDVIEQESSFVIVMDYVEGKGLDSLLKHGGAQDPNKVIEWGKQLCDVLSYLHNRERPIIYRDMKPANVILKPDGNLVLLDFTTAREFKSGNVEDTTCLGTRGYAAPEQFGGRGQTDARTDVYGLGATLYHLISGHNPCEPPYEIKKLGYWIPGLADSGIEEVVAKCTQPNPDNRYQSCAELRYDLDHVHDKDKRAVQSRKRIWRGFLACCIVAVLGVAGMIAFTITGNRATANTYSNYITEARTATDLESATEYFKKAIELDPSSAEGYEEFLTYVENDLVITTEEYTEIRACFLNTHGGTKTNMDSLRKADRDAVAYRLANDIYFFYEGSDNRTSAREWYGMVIDSSNLTDQEVELANALYTIGNYYARLSTANAYSLNAETYLTFWEDLTSITDGDLVSKTGRTVYAVALYKELVVQIIDNATNFRAYGIDDSELSAQLDKVETGLTDISNLDSNPDVLEMINEVSGLIVNAENSIKTAYATVGG